MTLFTGIMLYLVVWWMVLFTMLPWGNQPEEQVEAGHAESAPARPRLWLKVGATTLLSVVIWIILYLVITSGLFSLR